MKPMKSLLALILMTASAPTFAQNPRQNAVDKAVALVNTAQDLSDDVMDRCGCQNTSRVLADIAEVAVDVEVEARFGTPATATLPLKDVIRKVRELRGYLANVPNRRLRLDVKRDLIIAVNDLGFAVMGTNWVVVHPAPDGDSEEAFEAANDAQLEGIEANLNREAGHSF